MTNNKETLYGSIAAAIFALFAFAAILYGLSGCKTVKRNVNTRDSVVIHIKDSVRQRTITRRKDSTVIKDTLIRVKYDRAEHSFKAGDTKDTAIRSGRATLRKTVNNGVVTVQADCDSFDILVNDMRLIISDKQQENELLVKQFQDYKMYHSDSTTIKKSGSFGTWVRSWLGWIACIALIVVRMWRSKSLVFW